MALNRISFLERVETASRTVPPLRRGSDDVGLVLKSLYLIRIEPLVVEMTLESFTTVDIKHLKSVSFLISPLSGLLRANMGSLQKVKIDHINIPGFENEIDPDILTSANYLSSIEFEQSYLEDTPFRLFGDLANLRALTTIQILLSDDLHENLGEVEVQHWAKVDASLVRAHSAEVNIYASFCEGLHCIRPHRMDLHAVEVVEKWLPLVSSSGRLHVYSRADCSPLNTY
ncbi:hypothetical protein B0H19DRAFT_121501 [Mycena capillaripes]|nr:hypothetical protein B0H19DRAFT_121501 [Mycena capillaripes]